MLLQLMELFQVTFQLLALTYEDLTNIDSVGLVTARDGIFIPDNKEVKMEILQAIQI